MLGFIQVILFLIISLSCCGKTGVNNNTYIKQSWGRLNGDERRHTLSPCEGSEPAHRHWLILPHGFLWQLTVLSHLKTMPLDFPCVLLMEKQIHCDKLLRITRLGVLSFICSLLFKSEIMIINPFVEKAKLY